MLLHFYKDVQYVLSILMFVILLTSALIILERYLLAIAHSRNSALIYQPLNDGLKLFLKGINLTYSNNIIFHLTYITLTLINISFYAYYSVGIIYSYLALIFYSVIILGIISTSMVSNKYAFISLQRLIIISFIFDCIALILIQMYSTTIYATMYMTIQYMSLICLIGITSWLIIGCTFRSSFDNIESEGEVIAGIYTELSNIIYAFVILVEYIELILLSNIFIGISQVCTSFFIGIAFITRCLGIRLRLDQNICVTCITFTVFIFIFVVLIGTYTVIPY